MKKIALSQAKDDLSRVLKDARKQAIVITRHGKPAGVLVGFADDDDWFEYRLLNDPRFARRIAAARRRFSAGKGIPVEQIELSGF
jgi:prevent-host-death family protein